MYKPKNTGIIRKVDELGRVVIPIEIRNQFDIVEKTPLEIFIEGSRIILEKHEKTCYFCDHKDNLVEFNNGMICQDCLTKIKKL